MGMATSRTRIMGYDFVTAMLKNNGQATFALKGATLNRVPHHGLLGTLPHCHVRHTSR